ncbi:DNA mismatch repair protein MutS [Alicyclobacillus fastidiosus]|uniref:DNA mismatch repair protein MutS n=2 Tax=Alicyclobacillus fastidiosus TaxID=392011 RepID=A0ABV5ABW3_9BACL|nr:DNA mismatch repair protein MutS [Alicyclobacillus fastidiosus]WEH11986.1 DNA mismatch repair protein MutS [Alicyclobacillus fastidiosus]
MLMKLEFDKVKQRLATYAMSYLGRRQIDALAPMTNHRQIEATLAQTAEALTIVATGSSVPLPALEGLEMALSNFGKGIVMTIAELEAMLQFLRSTLQLKRYMQKREDIAPSVCGLARNLAELTAVSDELTRCLYLGRLNDCASGALAKLRKERRTLEERAKRKLDGALSKYRTYLQDDIVTTRDGRYVLSVKKEHKRMVKGIVHGESASGQTLFVEPEEMRSMLGELDVVRAEEELEQIRVLGALTAMIEVHGLEIWANLEIVGHYDFLFSKAKYARAIGGVIAAVNTEGRIVIKEGRHPLLEARSQPLDFHLGTTYQTLVVTGPNTGGKTVCLKTVGLLTLMIQSGLLVPVGAGSDFAVFTDVLVDIGDGQSIEQSLSTFSSHVKSVIDILKTAGARSLVLLDELATGTDPGEGIGLSIAVLEELHHRGARVVATTHFNEIKQFAAATEGFENARMEFDAATLQPLYRLCIGEAGHSYAFEIAAQLGVGEAIIRRSREIAAMYEHRGGERNTRCACGGNSLAAEPPLRAKRQGEAPSSGLEAPCQPATVPLDKEQSEATGERPTFQVGDRVWIHSLKRSGIVYSLPDSRGNMVLVVQRQKLTINHKRVAPYLKREDLYPDNYDLDIVLESKDVRRKRKIMRRKHVEGLSIDHPKP